MEEFEKLAYKIHGFVIGSSDSDTDSGPEEFDRAYYLLKPPPLDYDSIKDKIVEIPAPCDKLTKRIIHNDINIPLKGNSEILKIKRKRKRKSKLAKEENYLSNKNPVSICHSLTTDGRINTEKNNCSTTLRKQIFEERKNLSLDVKENKGLNKNISNQVTSGSTEKKRILKLLQPDIKELNKIQTDLDQLKLPDLGFSKNRIKKERKRLHKKEGEIYEKWFAQYKLETRYLTQRLKERFEKWLKDNKSLQGCEYIKENKGLNKNSTLGLSLGAKKRISPKSTHQTVSNQLSTGSTENKRIHKLLQLDIKELNNIQTDLDQLKLPDLGFSKNRIKNERKRLHKKEGEIYEKWFTQYKLETKYLRQKQKEMFEKWLKDNKSLQDCEDFNKNKVQRSNDIQNNSVQINDFKIIKENDSKKVKIQNSGKIQGEVKPNVVISGKSTSKKLEQISIIAQKKEIEDKYFKRREKEIYEEWLKRNKSSQGCANIEKNKVQQSKNIKNNTAQVNDFEIKKNNSKKVKDICTKNSINIQGKVETKVITSDKNKSKVVEQGSNIIPKKKNAAVRRELSYSDKVKTNKVSDSNDKRNVNSLTCHEVGSILGFSDKCDTCRPYLSSNDEMKQNLQIENHVDRTFISSIQQEFKGNKEHLHCLKDLNSDVMSDGYEFVGKNFQHFNENHVNVSLNESYVREGTGYKEKNRPLLELKENNNGENKDLHCLKTLNSDVKSDYEFFGEKNQYFMEKHFDMSLVKSAENGFLLELKKDDGENTDDVKSGYFDFVGSTFQHFPTLVKPVEVIKSTRCQKKKPITVRQTLKIDGTDATKKSKKQGNTYDLVQAKKLNTDVNNLSDIRHHYYDYTDQNFQSYMEFREIYLNKPLGNISHLNMPLDNISQRKSTKGKSKNKIAGVEKVTTNTLNEILKNDVRCYYYDYVGQNFQPYMEFREIYLNMSLGNIIAQRKGKNKIAEVEEITANTFEILKDDVRCYYYDYLGDNFRPYMEFREIYLNMSPDNMPERKHASKGKSRNEIMGNIGGNILEGKNLSTVMQCDIKENNMSQKKQNAKGKSRKKNSGDKKITTTKCDTRDTDKVNDIFQDYNISSKKCLSVDSNYELFLKVIHIMLILLMAYITKLVIFQYFVYICLILIYCYLIFIHFYKI